MVKASYIVFLVLALGVMSCNKDYPKMRVVRDCTGVYLQNEKGFDYYVCNASALSAIETGTVIKVKTDNVTQCYGLLEEVDCTLAHASAGKIEVLDIKD